MAEVVTGEAVVLDLTVARFPSRILALLLDVLVQLPVLFFLEVVVFLSAGKHLNGASAAAVYLAGLMLVVIGYPLIFETLSRGKTLGKLALGIRVVCDDGSPVRFRQALIRALSLALIEFWISPVIVIGLPAGLITSMVSAKGKRLGDMFAGTFVIQERVPRRQELAPVFTVVPPALAGWAQHLELSRLSDATAAAASSYLRRYYELQPPAREHLGLQLATAVAAQVSPPPPAGADPAAFLAAVLAVRRDREFARLRARHAAPPGPGQFQAPAFAGIPVLTPQDTLAVTPHGTVVASPQDGSPESPPASVPDGSPDTVALGQQADAPSSAPPEDFGFAAPL